jgi:hypothetical protein
MNPLKETAMCILEAMFERTYPSAYEETPRYDNSSLWERVTQKMTSDHGRQYLSKQEFADSLRYLESINAVKTILSTEFHTIDGVTELLWHGRFLYYEMQEAKAKQSEPVSATLPAPNFIHVEAMYNSQIQQGTHDSQQMVRTEAWSLDKVREYLQTLKGGLNELGFEEELRAEIAAEITTVESQIASPKPKQTIINESLRTIHELLLPHQDNPVVVKAEQSLKQIPS